MEEYDTCSLNADALYRISAAPYPDHHPQLPLPPGTVATTRPSGQLTFVVPENDKWVSHGPLPNELKYDLRQSPPGLMDKGTRLQ
jgi:hypothetical protein